MTWVDLGLFSSPQKIPKKQPTNHGPDLFRTIRLYVTKKLLRKSPIRSVGQGFSKAIPSAHGAEKKGDFTQGPWNGTLPPVLEGLTTNYPHLNTILKGIFRDSFLRGTFPISLTQETRFCTKLCVPSCTSPSPEGWLVTWCLRNKKQCGWRGRNKSWCFPRNFSHRKKWCAVFFSWWFYIPLHKFVDKHVGRLEKKQQHHIVSQKWWLWLFFPFFMVIDLPYPMGFEPKIRQKSPIKKSEKSKSQVGISTSAARAVFVKLKRLTWRRVYHSGMASQWDFWEQQATLWTTKAAEFRTKVGAFQTHRIHVWYIYLPSRSKTKLCFVFCKRLYFP